MGDKPQALVVKEMSKSYGKLRALKPTSLAVDPGEIVGLVGPNGSGKTTLLECVLGVKKPDSGSARIAGYDMKSKRTEALRHCGAQFQETSLPPFSRLADTMWLWKKFYRETEDPRELCEEFGVGDKYKSLFVRLSGGQKRKALIALAFLGKPDLVILDEPTAGIDPAARAEFWSSVQRRKEFGRSVLVTSHQLAEMDANCDRIAFIFDGSLRAYGTAEKILQDHKLAVTYISYGQAAEVIEKVTQVASNVDGVTWVRGKGGHLRIVVERQDVHATLMAAIQSAGIEPSAFAQRPANLEDVFLMETYGEPESTEQ